MLNMAAHLED